MSRCGDCRMCCRVMAVDEIQKPADVRCAHQTRAGCGIYSSRPPSCQAYECMWLESQDPERTDVEAFPPEWRPDRIGFVMDGAGVDPVHKVVAWRAPSGGESRLRSREARDFALLLSERGFRVMIRVGDRRAVGYHEFLEKS